MIVSNRKTKIIATIGPASDSPGVLSRLIEEGLDTARLNFSHDIHDVHRARIKLIRELSEKAGRHIAIIGDLQGPKMRVGIMPEEGVVLRTGESIILDTSKQKYESGVVPIQSKAFQEGATKGGQVFLDDGSLLLEIKKKNGTEFVCEVIRGGTLFSRKGVNVPKLELRSSIFEKKDHDDIKFGLKEKVDYLALSFLRDGNDVDVARRLVGKANVKLIAKIERHEALDHLEEIIDKVDAVMVARGDLGIETPLWQLPVRQKEIIAHAHRVMKPVIVATQMLESMTKNSIPTRAEVSDVANAVYDSADAVMLSAETASGKFPVEALSIMRKVLEGTEGASTPNFLNEKDSFTSVSVGVAKSAKYIATQVGAKAIVVGTATGYSARAVSRYRPAAPIIAIAGDDKAARSLAFVWGVQAVVIPDVESIDDVLKKSMAYLKSNKYAKKDDRIVFVSGLKLGEIGRTNNLSVVRVS